MDLQQFGVSILEAFIANIPALGIFASFLFSNIGKMKKEVSNFGLDLKDVSKDIINKIDEKVERLLEKTEERLDKTIDKVDNTLDTINNKVEGFEKQIESTNVLLESVLKTNKVALDIIGILISGDEKSIMNGVASKIVNKLSMTKEELEEYPYKLLLDEKLFVKAVKEHFIILGKKNFEKLVAKSISGVEYEKEEKL